MWNFVHDRQSQRTQNNVFVAVPDNMFFYKFGCFPPEFGAPTKLKSELGTGTSKKRGGNKAVSKKKQKNNVSLGLWETDRETLIATFAKKHDALTMAAQGNESIGIYK